MSILYKVYGKGYTKLYFMGNLGVTEHMVKYVLYCKIKIAYFYNIIYAKNFWVPHYYSIQIKLARM